MTDNRFTVIKGGIDLPPSIDKRDFVNAYATDTRLMGVLGLSIHWEIEKSDITDDFYQFFYLDAEEYAIENYISVYGNSPKEIHKVENTLIGGLGGKKNELTERECRIILTEFAGLNKKYEKSFPGKYDEYAFLLECEPQPDPREINSLMKKICTPIENDYQLIHYFLMRMFGKDMTAARFLAAEHVDLELFNDIPPASLCKNTIDADASSESPGAYICESLIEIDITYMVAVSKIEVDGRGTVVNFERVSAFKVTPAEAALQLARPEFMTIYTLLFDASEFEMRCGSLIDEAMTTSYETGKMYMMFNKHNNHVKSRIFLLSEDVSGLLYISETGQMLAVSYSLHGIHTLESNIRKSPIAGSAFPIAKYEFKEPILYDFLQSDFYDFNDFLEFIRDDDH